MIVGQKVVCINDEAPWYHRSSFTTWIKKGTVYVVRGVFMGIGWTGTEGEVGIYLQGIHNPLSNVPPYPERGYNSERFAPIEELPPKQRAEKEPVEAPERRELVEV